MTEAYGPLTPVLRHPGGPLRAVLERIAKRKGVDIGTVLLLWTIQSGAVAVTTSTRSENIRKLAAISELEDLTADDMKAIADGGKSVHFRFYSVSRGLPDCRY